MAPKERRTVRSRASIGASVSLKLRATLGDFLASDRASFTGRGAVMLVKLVVDPFTGERHGLGEPRLAFVRPCGHHTHEEL